MDRDAVYMENRQMSFASMVVFAIDTLLPFVLSS